MSKQGEINYLKKIEKAGVSHAVGKPFSDINCGSYLAEIGAILNLISGSPKKILDVGCGTGWTSRFFAKAGHAVVGVDISPDMIQYAQQETAKENINNIKFITEDFEKIGFKDEFDVVVFFDSLHHADNEEKALQNSFNALKDGGMCILAEPGKGHDKRGREVAKKFDVNEKDMNPRKTVKLGKKIGFKKMRIYPRLIHATQLLYGTTENILVSPFLKKVVKAKSLSFTIALGLMLLKRRDGIVVMIK